MSSPGTLRFRTGTCAKWDGWTKQPRVVGVGGRGARGAAASSGILGEDVCTVSHGPWGATGRPQSGSDMIKGVFRTVCAAAVSGWMGVRKAHRGGRKPSWAVGLGKGVPKREAQSLPTWLTWNPGQVQPSQGPGLRHSGGPSASPSASEHYLVCQGHPS